MEIRFLVLNEFNLSNTVMLLSKKEKEKKVIELANQGKTTREIAKEVRISLKTIGQILNKVTGDDEAEKEQRLKDSLSMPKLLRCLRMGCHLKILRLNWILKPLLFFVIIRTISN